MIKWVTAIQDASTKAETANTKLKELVEQRNIAKELSDLIVYCVTVPFNENGLLFIYLFIVYFIKYFNGVSFCRATNAYKGACVELEGIANLGIHREYTAGNETRIFFEHILFLFLSLYIIDN